jgi:putative two-component system response regulator
MNSAEAMDRGPGAPQTERPVVLVVDDEVGILTAIRRSLKSVPAEVVTAENAGEAIAFLHDHPVAVVVSDHMMPGMTGLELLALVRQNWPRTLGIMMTASGDIQLAADAVNRRLVRAFLTKPWTVETLRTAVGEALEVWHASGEAAGERLKNGVGEAVRAQATRAVLALARAMDARDRYTRNHSERVAGLSVALGRALKLPPVTLEALRVGGLLHDVGKIGVLDAVLLKPSKLSAEEFEAIRRHPGMGASIVEPLGLAADVVAVIRQHHENHDGTGYPDGLTGDQIHLLARLVHVVDAYEAMRANRVYRTAREPDWIRAEMQRCRGTQFDPLLLDLFLAELDAGRVDAALAEADGVGLAPQPSREPSSAAPSG